MNGDIFAGIANSQYLVEDKELLNNFLTNENNKKNGANNRN